MAEIDTLKTEPKLSRAEREARFAKRFAKATSKVYDVKDPITGEMFQFKTKKEGTTFLRKRRLKLADARLAEKEKSIDKAKGEADKISKMVTRIDPITGIEKRFKTALAGDQWVSTRKIKQAEGIELYNPYNPDARPIKVKSQESANKLIAHWESEYKGSLLKTYTSVLADYEKLKRLKEGGGLSERKEINFNLLEQRVKKLEAELGIDIKGGGEKVEETGGLLDIINPFTWGAGVLTPEEQLENDRVDFINQRTKVLLDELKKNNPKDWRSKHGNPLQWAKDVAAVEWEKNREANNQPSMSVDNLSKQEVLEELNKINAAKGVK